MNASCPNKNMTLYKRLEKQYDQFGAYAVWYYIQTPEFTAWFGKGQNDSEGNPRMNAAFQFTNERGETMDIKEIIPDQSAGKLQDVEVVHAPLPNKGASQAQVLGSLSQTTKLIDTKKTTDAQGRERYRFRDGKMIRNRVTDLQDRLFRRFRSAKDAEKENNAPRNVFFREMGTKLHTFMEDAITGLQKGRKVAQPSFMDKAQHKHLMNGAQKIINEINEYQQRIDPKGKAQIITEQVVYDPDTDTGGSIDIIAIYSDGSADIYDFKFINFKTNKKGDVIVDNINYYKEDSYDIQISEYKKILKKHYGIDRIRKSRIIPVNTQWVHNDKSKSGFSERLSRIEMLSNSYTDPIPVGKELTDDQRLNEFIVRLYNVRDKLKYTIKGQPDNDTARARLDRIRSAIKALQLRNDINHLIKEVNSLVKQVNDRMMITDKDDDAYLGNDELLQFYHDLESYRGFAAAFRDTMQQVKSQNKSAFDRMSRAISDLESRVQLTFAAVNDKLRERVMDIGQERGISRILEEQVEQGGLLSGSGFKYLSDYDHPIFRAFYDYIDQVHANTRKRNQEISKEIGGLIDNLKKWGKANGLSGLDIYKPLINEKTGNLQSEWSDEFYEQFKKARAEGDIKWLKANLTQTIQQRQDFAAKKAEKFALYDRIYDDPGQRKNAKERWMNSNDLKRDTAWMKVSLKRVTVKDKARWTNPAYQRIMNTPELKAFYDKHVEIIHRASEILPDYLSKEFIPNVQQSLVERIAAGGMKMADYIGGMRNAFEVREGDSTIGMIDPATGELRMAVPVLYVDKIFDQEGNEDIAQKSLDLGMNLLLFDEMTTNYELMSNIEADVLAMREVISNQDQIITDKFGRTIKDEVTGELRKNKGNEHAHENFNTFLRYYLYGQRIQSQDKRYKVGEKNFSANKAVLKAMQLFSLQTLSLNVVSGIGGFMGAMSNTFMSGSKGSHYTNGQIIKSIKMLSKPVSDDGKKLRAADAFFEISQEDFSFVRAEQRSASLLKKIFSLRNFFALQRTENIVSTVTLGSMMQQYGVNSEGKPELLRRLPQNSKSIFELSKIKNDIFAIDGMTEEGMRLFRQKVRKVAAQNRGNSNDEDINLIQTNIGGRILMHFKTWMPAMVDERIRGVRYNYVLDEIEGGRYRVGWNMVTKDGIVDNGKELMKLAAEVASFGYYKRDVNRKLAEAKFAEWMADERNAKLADEKNLTVEDYIAMRRGQMRALATEIRMYCIVAAAIFAMKLDLDDDDEPDYRSLWMTRKAFELTNKLSLELGAFFNPKETIKLITSPFPVSGLLTNTVNFFQNTFDETTDVLFGENNPRDKSDKLHYTLKFLPGANAVSRWTELTE